ncbi:unnamed protein product [Polarella glacialis]|uniref:Uncharacterized protein n=1 Tax=Polarella glacialis TaxID=89957 RepID=A0A813I9F1_POLGL|nr:unnamed protein product [Polarella glacialis]
MADAAGLDLFKQEVSRLQRQVEELRQGLSKVSNEQSMQRRNAELLHEATQQWVSLEDRIAGLERERETSARASRNNLDSIATRVTELGVEVAQMPTTLEVQDGLMQLEQLVTASEARTRETFRESLDQRLETLQVDTSLKLSECIEGCSKEIQGCILDLGYCREHSDSCRRDISGLLRQIWGDEGLACDSAAKEGASATQSPMAAEARSVPPMVPTGDEQLPQLRRGEASLASRLALAEHEVAALSEHMALKADLEDVVHRLATKAEAGHVHDRLVSADGSASFVL